MSDFTPERLTEMKARAETPGEWMRIKATTLLSLIAALEAAWAERDEVRLERKSLFEGCKDLSGQGWEALNDARLLIQNLGTPADLNEAVQNIDLAQASFADTIIASERRAATAETLSTLLQAELAEAREGLRDTADALEINLRRLRSWNGNKKSLPEVEEQLRRARAIIEKEQVK